MMGMDTFQQKWAEQDRKLDLSIHLNRQLLMASNMTRVQSPLRRFAFFQLLEALLGAAVTLMTGQFIYAHWHEPRFVVPAMVLHIWVIANVAAAVRQAVMALQIDHAKPIASIQKQLESLRVLRIWVIRWDLLTGQIVWWIPFLIVAFKSFAGVDVYQVCGETFLAVNVLFGLALIPLAIWVSRKFGERMGRSAIVKGLVTAIAGYNLNAAIRSLGAVSEFASEN
jgi:hypothetical protein